ncbi:MFS transporter [Sphingomonas sp. MG17]|uniref:MFS transporter n=1 Tax=Sphingomonas tagetis TaxID=2949092 RepID=A0A9X2HPZ1_9SPHN|nr:MFS transporter [Sphingomonas tagetis]
MFAANLYYAQPLLTTIAAELGLAPEFAGSIVSASQLGYGVGLFLLVPLSDMLENKRLVLVCGGLALVGILGLATARSAPAFLCCAAFTGIFSSGAQILIPYLSHLVPPARRGRIISSVMAGILTSVMLARPFALFVAAAFGWRTVYWLSATATVLLGIGLWRMMPQRKPRGRIPYRRTLSTMFVLFAFETQVRRRAIYQAVLFGTFTMFWAVIPILLADHFGYSKAAIGLFALVGVGGALAAPMAGRIADRGSTRLGMMSASLLVAIAFLVSIWSIQFALPIALVITSLLIDGSIQVSQVLSRIVVLNVAPDIRGRINALYMTITFLSGALGSMAGVSIYFSWGWSAVATLGITAGVSVFLAVLVEGRIVKTDLRGG